MRAGDLVVVFNSAPQRRTQRIEALTGDPYALHPVQATGADAVTKTSSYGRSSGTFSVPGRTVAVFTRS